MERKELLTAKGVYKSFGPTKALVNVDFKIKTGEIHGLIGENGSGKSTLSTIMVGIQNADAGELYLYNELYKPKSLIDAMNHQVCMIVQEQGTLNGISVAANIFAGKESDFTKYGLLNVKKMNEKARELLESIGIMNINVEQMVDRMSFEDRKLLEVARAEYSNPNLLIIDETTTALGKEGRVVMYNLIKRMRDENKSVIFISHDIDELISVCDLVTILRDGVIVGTLEKNEMQQAKMKQMMVGREIAENFYRNEYDGRLTDEVVLKAKNIFSGMIKNVNLELHKGEILGIGGLADCGMHELGKVVFGLTIPEIGTVEVVGKGTIKNSKQAVCARMGYVSKNRDTEALMSGGSIKDNMCLAVLPKLVKCGLIFSKKEDEVVKEWKEKLSIKMKSAKQFCMHLSGGNKQKVSIAKWLATNPDIIIFDCPTRGIDIGVKSDIYKLLTSLKNSGKAIIMISEELPELIGMSDRIIMMKKGVIEKELLRSSEINENTLIDYMI